MKHTLSAVALVLVLSALIFGACAPPVTQPTAVPPLSEGEVCVDKTTGTRLSYQEALQIARDSECLEQGQLKETHFCNENTGTWWIDLDIVKPGCAPACVVNVNDKSAAINWRCTGLLPPAEGAALSEKPRVVAPAVDAADLAAVVAGNSAFAFDLYQALREAEGNLFYSPYSISAALAMTYAGARGDTELQMADTLHFTLPQARLHPAFNGLDQMLAQRGKGAAGKDEQGFRLNIVNAIWGQKDYAFLAEFLDLLAENYGAGLRLLDFVRAPEEARLIINEWVSEQTEGRIKDLIPQGLIDELTRLVLTNAIYFNAAWAQPFQEELTADGPFYLLDGSQVTVPMMRQTESFGYGEGQGYQAVELPYDGQELSMVILLPEKGNFEPFEAALSAEGVQAIVQGLQQRQVALTLPRFKFESAFALADTLAAMGMPDAFGDAADFSGMTGERDLFISEVIHKAFVAVDEAGTEAAAATAVIMKRLSMPEQPVEVSVDRPFVFLIRDIETGAILFIGRVVNPTA
ncbi:MAG: serpin family protein [Anaerolineae bacterium]|nr:serpin family protein [Anaerolineae bacterium]